MVGYSRLMAADEAATVSTLKFCRDIIARLIARRGGGWCGSTRRATHLLAEFQARSKPYKPRSKFKRRSKATTFNSKQSGGCSSTSKSTFGDVIEEANGTIYGDGVNIAARMEALAEAGKGICISSSVYDAVEGKLDFGFDFLGEHEEPGWTAESFVAWYKVWNIRDEDRSKLMEGIYKTGVLDAATK